MHEVFELTSVVELYLQQPARAIRLGVDDVWVFQHLGVDLDDLAADGRLDRRGGIVRLDMAHAPPGAEHITEIWQLQGCDLPHLILEVVAQPQHGNVIFQPDPNVSVAEPELGHDPRIMNEIQRSGAALFFRRKSGVGESVKRIVRFLLLIAVGAVLVWLGSLLWQMLQGTGNVF